MKDKQITKEDMDWKIGEVTLEGHGVTIETKRNFFYRLWVILSNPFLYIFTGKIRW